MPPLPLRILPNFAKWGFHLSLPKTRFVHIDGEARQGSDARQSLRTARSNVVAPITKQPIATLWLNPAISPISHFANPTPPDRRKTTKCEGSHSGRGHI